MMSSKKLRRIPVVFNFEGTVAQSQRKALVPEHNTVAMIMQSIRARWLTDVKPHEALFILFRVDDDYMLMPISSTLREISNQIGNKENEPVFATVRSEATFG
jgi:hypothetical protein